MIQLPNNKKCYNLPEQVAQNLLNIQYLAEQYKNIDELPAIWADYKTAFDADLHTFEDWTTTFEGWENTLATYLANMSSAAVGAIAGQDIAPKDIAATGDITGKSIIENMVGYSATLRSETGWTFEKVYVGACKNGNKLTLVCAVNLTKNDGSASNNLTVCDIHIPNTVGANLTPALIGGYSFLKYEKSYAVASVLDHSENTEVAEFWRKGSDSVIECGVNFINGATVSRKYYVRLEATFLLSNSL